MYLKTLMTKKKPCFVPECLKSTKIPGDPQTATLIAEQNDRALQFI